MKLKLSKFYWINLYTALGICFIVEIGLYTLFREATGETIILKWCLMLFYILICVFFAFSRWKYLLTLKIDEKTFSSFLFGKLKCKVFMEREIYYVLFKCRESNTNTKHYIAISNECFDYKEKKNIFNWPGRTFVDCHDISRIIILPYNKKTKHLCTIEKWTNIN